MFGPRMFNDQENFEEPNYLPSDFPASFLPTIPLEGFGTDFYPRDDPSFFLPMQDFEGFDQPLPFMFDPAMYQTIQEDFKRLYPGFDMFAAFPKDLPGSENKALAHLASGTEGLGQKIGTLTVEERREKVQKFLEKRKRRVFKKRISYQCRKRVADSRVRVKGRFVTKEQAKMMEQAPAEEKKED
jgi:hypothetical protein